jgi:hypothetical protein
MPTLSTVIPVLKLKMPEMTFGGTIYQIPYSYLAGSFNSQELTENIVIPEQSVTIPYHRPDLFLFAYNDTFWNTSGYLSRLGSCTFPIVSVHLNRNITGALKQKSYRCREEPFDTMFAEFVRNATLSLNIVISDLEIVTSLELNTTLVDWADGSEYSSVLSTTSRSYVLHQTVVTSLCGNNKKDLVVGGPTIKEAQSVIGITQWGEAPGPYVSVGGFRNLSKRISGLDTIFTTDFTHYLQRRGLGGDGGDLIGFAKESLIDPADVPPSYNDITASVEETVICPAGVWTVPRLWELEYGCP